MSKVLKIPIANTMLKVLNTHTLGMKMKLLKTVLKFQYLDHNGGRIDMLLLQCKLHSPSMWKYDLEESTYAERTGYIAQTYYLDHTVIIWQQKKEYEGK